MQTAWQCGTLCRPGSVWPLRSPLVVVFRVVPSSLPCLQRLNPCPVELNLQINAAHGIGRGGIENIDEVIQLGRGFEAQSVCLAASSHAARHPGRKYIPASASAKRCAPCFFKLSPKGHQRFEEVLPQELPALRPAL